MNIPPGLAEEARVMFIPDRWLFRPGDIVSALVDDPGGRSGIYVPMNAVKPADDRTGHVFVVEDGKARLAAVRLLETVDDRVRIEPADEAAAARVREGARVVSSKVHFLVDGEEVNVVETEGASE